MRCRKSGLKNICSIFQAFYHLATRRESPLGTSCFWGAGVLAQQGCDEGEHVEKDSRHQSSGRLILLLGAFSAAVCLSVYTAGMASAIATTEDPPITLRDLNNKGFKLVLTKVQVGF